MAICEDESLNVGNERPRQESDALPVAAHSGIVDWKVAVFVRNVNKSSVFFLYQHSKDVEHAVPCRPRHGGPSRPFVFDIRTGIIIKQQLQDL